MEQDFIIWNRFGLYKETLGFIMEREYNGILKYKMKVGFKIKSIWALKSMLGWDLKSIYRTLLTPGVNEHHGALKVPP